MNDFTKEELEDIRNCVWCYDDLSEDGMHAELLKKIDKAIAAYPEPVEEKKPHPECPRCNNRYKAIGSEVVKYTICNLCKGDVFYE